MLRRLIEAIGRFRDGGVRIAAWSTYATESRRLSLGIKDRETGNVHAPLGIGDAAGARYLLAWSDGLVSRGYLERRRLHRDVESTLLQARAAAYHDPDAARVAGPSPIPEVRLRDDTVAALAAGDVETLVPRLERIRERAARAALRTWSGSFGASATEAEIATSEGLQAGVRATSFGWHVTLDGEIGDGFAARALDDDGAFEDRVERLVELVGRLREPAVAPPPGENLVLLHPNVVEGYVLAALFHNLDGSTVAHGEGAFGRERFGAAEPVLREDLTLRLDPLEPLRSGSYRFTSEGVPAARCTFVERGRLSTPVLDLKYAHRLGLPPTPAPADWDTVHLDGPPEIGLDEAWAAGGGGAFVPSVLGTHTQDLASGDFSLSAPQAMALGPAGPRGRLRVTISGNLFDVLRRADLRKVRFPGQRTPGLLIRCHLEPK